MCIGNNFAMAEMSFFIFSFLKKFQLKSTGQTPDMKALITLRPDKVLLNIQIHYFVHIIYRINYLDFVISYMVCRILKHFLHLN